MVFALGDRDDGDETIPEDKRLIDLELGQEEAVEPLNADDFEIIKGLWLFH